MNRYANGMPNIATSGCPEFINSDRPKSKNKKFVIRSSGYRATMKIKHVMATKTLCICCNPKNQTNMGLAAIKAELNAAINGLIENANIEPKTKRELK